VYQQMNGNIFLSSPHHLQWSYTIPTCIFFQATHPQIFFAYLFICVILNLKL
jgi:hypothetical protein